ncbi:hypothetical protein ACWOA0_09310 [Ignavigranum ruoffiae]
MKKLIIMLSLIFLFFNGLTVVAQTDEIEELSDDISKLEEELTAKKAVLENLSKDYKKIIEFEEMDMDISEMGFEGYKMTLIERGLDTENYAVPVAYWLIKTEITSSERQSEWDHASAIIVTDEYTDFAQDRKFDFYKKNENDELVFTERDISRNYAKGHVYYYKVLVPIFDEDAKYYLADTTSDDGLRIPMYNQD